MNRMLLTGMLVVGIASIARLGSAAERAMTPEELRFAENEAGGKFDLSFPGGTPDELAVAMRKAGEKSWKIGFALNVLVPSELKDVRIPPMELRSVDFVTVFQSLNRLLGNTMQWISIGPGEVWVLYRPPDNRKTKAFYVGNLLRKFKVDDITTAVQTTWRMAAKDAAALKPELKYHQDTQLLIALASSAQLETAGEVFTQLNLAVESGGEGKVGDAKKTR
jgi:hypothetical protein